jgi:SAM-dependent methyltransferase
LINAIKKYFPHAIRKKIGTFINLISSLGGESRCPVCNKTITHFRPLPEFYFDNARKHGFIYQPDQAETLNYQSYSCPFCGATDRDRLYALYIQSFICKLRPGEAIKIIDFAPSASLSLFIRNLIAPFQQKLSYTTADMHMADVDDKIDIADMKLYNDNQFDFFICSHILEHVPNDVKAIRELYRILKPHGSGILMVPIILGLEEIDEDPSVTDESERWRRFGQNDHVRIYSKKGFMKRVRDAGFLIHVYGKDYFGEQVFEQNGITNQSILYVVEK